jgi:hypothetical protein
MPTVFDTSSAGAASARNLTAPGQEPWLYDMTSIQNDQHAAGLSD